MMWHYLYHVYYSAITQSRQWWIKIKIVLLVNIRYHKRLKVQHFEKHSQYHQDPEPESRKLRVRYHISRAVNNIYSRLFGVKLETQVDEMNIRTMFMSVAQPRPNINGLHGHRIFPKRRVASLRQLLVFVLILFLNVFFYFWWSLVCIVFILWQQFEHSCTSICRKQRRNSQDKSFH